MWAVINQKSFISTQSSTQKLTSKTYYFDSQSLSSYGRNKWLIKNNDILMSVFWQNLSRRQKQKEGRGVKTPWKESKQKNLSLLTKYQTKMVPGDILTTWLSVLSLCFQISVSHWSKVIEVTWLFSSTEELKGKGINLQMAYPVYKEHRQQPSTKSLPFGVIRLQPHLLVGSAGKNKATKNKDWWGCPTRKVPSKNAGVLWGSVRS